jgi:hypothetical protein
LLAGIVERALDKAGGAAFFSHDAPSKTKAFNSGARARQPAVDPGAVIEVM